MHTYLHTCVHEHVRAYTNAQKKKQIKRTNFYLTKTLLKIKRNITRKGKEHRDFKNNILNSHTIITDSTVNIFNKTVI